MIKECRACRVPFTDTSSYGTARFCSNCCRSAWEAHQEREAQRIAKFKANLLAIRAKLDSRTDQ